VSLPEWTRREVIQMPAVLDTFGFVDGLSRHELGIAQRNSSYGFARRRTQPFGVILLPEELLESANLADRPPGHGQGVPCQPLERLPCMQQQARSRRFAVFSPKRAQRRGVSQARSRRCLDFDGQEAATSLDYKIYLLAGCRSPIQDFRRLGPSITPAHEILEYDVLEVRPARFGNAGQMKAQADIAPIEFGSLDEAPGAIHGIRENANEQEGRLEQVQITVHGWLVQRDVARTADLFPSGHGPEC
jgi:hypothetical protein